jgi:Pyruvate/2-oxoacid:ferredoxin oxidoreductase gamma subunit
MYLGLRQALGDSMTNLLMERLPPDDFARSGEVQLPTLRVDNIARTIKVLIGSMITVSTVMIGLLTHIALSVG